MKAILNNYRQAPRKTALVAGLVRGKTVADALTQLRFTTKKASAPIVKLIESAVANAKNMGVENPEILIIKEIRVDKGVTLKRHMPRARGSASKINKRSSHVMLVLGTKDGSSVATSATKDAEVIEAPKVKKTAKTEKTTKTKASKK